MESINQNREILCIKEKKMNVPEEMYIINIVMIMDGLLSVIFI